MPKDYWPQPERMEHQTLRSLRNSFASLSLILLAAVFSGLYDIGSRSETRSWVAKITHHQATHALVCLVFSVKSLLSSIFSHRYVLHGECGNIPSRKSTKFFFCDSPPIYIIYLSQLFFLHALFGQNFKESSEAKYSIAPNEIRTCY